MNKRNIAIGAIVIFASIGAINFWIKDSKTPLDKTIFLQKKKQNSKDALRDPKKIITVQEKKQNFKDILVAPATKVFLKLQKQYEKTIEEIQKDPDSKYLQSLRATYKSDSNEDLLMALKPHPISLTLAQGAMESAWGTSRFFRQANNVFGVWSFNKNEKRIAAGEKRGDKTIWIKKYDSIEDSIENYYKVLATGFAYKEFRKEKMRSNDSLILAKKLDKYSEKGQEYCQEIIAMIKYNKFQEFDIGR
ncbi:MAG: Bax protein [Myxococcota bacterium]|jgi:Bax protein